MRRLFLIISLSLVVFASWSFLGKPVDQTGFHSAVEKIESEFKAIHDNPDFAAAIDTIHGGFTQLLGQFDKALEQLPEAEQESEAEQIDKPTLTTPVEDVFTIHNIGLGDSKEDVEKQLGAAKRSSYNEYGIKWDTYHTNYQNFIMAAYDKNNKVAGLYTNQDLIASTQGLKKGSPKESVLQQLGEPLTKIRKGMAYYQFEANRDYEMFLIDGSYVTVFFDKHQNNTLTSIQIVSKGLEQNKKDFYTEGSKQLMEGLEYQLFDVTNATRVNHDLPILTWDNHVRGTARDHSTDMAENQYFNHTNPKGQSPFDRMKEDDVFFTVAGENLASGQFSSIFAHEGLMNSMGHRENILKKDFERLGVGVAFDDKARPYYTENFYSK
ncbi:CAP domain-containing protein [Bacillus sp. V59.32b]|uniref:CAP domain-containing protein n=1 Tax=Bacillus sp. V59.32b TaxID=1758642 RepID=UPI0020B15A1D|nr:CAP domain-containing protein [Bacillus sp. V59.32b]